MAAHRLSDRTFGLAFAGLFAAIAAIGWLALSAVPVWAVVASAIFLVLAWLRPALLMPLNRLWEKITHRIATVTNFLLLGAFFVTCVLPMGLLLRVFGKDPMQRRLSPDADSYWMPVRRQVDAQTLRDMF